MAAGKIIITTSVGKEGIDAQNGKHLFVEDSPERFSQKIIDIFESKNNFDSLISEARNLIRSEYIWEKIIDEFERTLIEITKTKTV